jgi:EamA domain-containing membrane protein RarD
VAVPSADPRAAQRASLRRAVLHLVLGVVALDVVAMSVYYFAGIEHASYRTRMTFVVAWSVVTALTVAFLLRRVRAVREANRRELVS